MSTLIIGHTGSIGSRYRAIFDYLNEPYWGVDEKNSLDHIHKMAQKSERILLCTPTPTHEDYLLRLASLRKPVLCEKPIVTDSKRLQSIIEIYKMNQTPLNMVFQYAELIQPDPKKEGKSEYNFFRTGADGLIWDCIQIIGLANGEIELKNKSPIWTCKINGTSLKLSDMDYAYVSMIRKWLNGKYTQDMSEILRIHKKTEEMYDSELFKWN